MVALKRNHKVVDFVHVVVISIWLIEIRPKSCRIVFVSYSTIPDGNISPDVKFMKGNLRS